MLRLQLVRRSLGFPSLFRTSHAGGGLTAAMAAPVLERGRLAMRGAGPPAAESPPVSRASRPRPRVPTSDFASRWRKAASLLHFAGSDLYRCGR
jgi:hypothetical protein